MSLFEHAGLLLQTYAILQNDATTITTLDDTETGFYYLQSRYYDPIIGRFLFVGALMILSKSSFTTSTQPSSSMTCLRYSLMPLISALHSKSSRTMCLLGCFMYFMAFASFRLYCSEEEWKRRMCGHRG